ncbi:MAG: FAD binding domain-containing protein [Anaerolineales bacterium]|jgi:carbon-monoxide dehydrogenase medium subunit
MWQSYVNANSIDQVLELLGEPGKSSRIIAGGTDLILEFERGVRQSVDILIDITRIPGFAEIRLDENNRIHLGPMVTHNHCVASDIIRKHAFPLAQAAWQVGAPQIRNRGTIAGNLITASPANDTITPLMALDAEITLRSKSAERIVPIKDFYKGVRNTLMNQDEILVDISFQAMSENQQGTFLKLGLRQAQAISVVNVAIVLTRENDIVKKAAITMGSVAPTIIHAEHAETYLVGRYLENDVIEKTASFAKDDSMPIDDLRGSAIYRREMVRVLTARGLRSIMQGTEKNGFPEKPVLLWGNSDLVGKKLISQEKARSQGSQISTKVNGKDYQIEVEHDKTLLDFLRDDLGLIGTKEGCAEGECGACTVWLDGAAVMACLVPAPRADGAEIVTIEGLGDIEHLHPVQQAFVHDGAVQCGYCTPGFLMSAAKLLEEIPQPSRLQIKESITGNLCRCTGYYKIIDAIEHASQEEKHG